MTDKPHNYSRRALLKLSGTALTTTALAGCTDTTEPETSTSATVETSIQTSEETSDSDSDSNSGTDTDSDADSDAYTDETIETAQTVASTVRQSTVQVETGNGGGTGWVLDTENAYIVTNSHVVTDHNEVQITTYDDTTYTGTVIETAENQIPDVALIEINNASTFQTDELSLGNDETLEQNDTLVQVGHPFRVGQWVVAIGDYRQHNPRAGWFTSTLPTQPGNSGGPVVTLSGELVGMTSGSTSDGTRTRPSKHTESPPKLYSTYPEPQEVTTHVPVEVIKDTLERWKN